MRNLYRKILRECTLRFCKIYAIEQRVAAEANNQSVNYGTSANTSTTLYHLQNAVAAETMVREIVTERTNELYNKYNLKPTSK